MSGTRARWWDSLGVAFVAGTSGLFGLRYPSLTLDELSLLIYPDLVAHGRVPNRDFFTPYGPGGYWPLVAANEIGGGVSVIAERLVGLSYHVLLAVGIWALCRRYGRYPALLAGLLAALLSAGLLLVAYAWLLALAAAVWSLAMAQRRRWILCGVLAAITCTVRPELMAVLVVVLAIQLPSRAAAVRTAGGFLMGAVPLLVHVAIAGPDLVRNVFIDRLRPDNRLPFPPSFVGDRVMLVLVGLAVVALIADAIRCRDRASAADAVLAVGLLPQMLQRTDRDHLLFVGVLVLPLAVAAVMRRAGVIELLTVPSWVPAAFLGIVGVAGLALALVAPHGDRLQVGGRSLYTESPQASAWGKSVVATVRASVRPGEKVFVGATDMSRGSLTAIYIYYLAPELVPHAYFLELAPGISERPGSRLVDDLTASDVLALTEFQRSQAEQVFPYLPRGSLATNRYYRAHFCRIATEHEVEIWRRCR
jgi:hypothetical protein